MKENSRHPALDETWVSKVNNLWRFSHCFPRPTQVESGEIICIIWTHTMQFIKGFVLWPEFTGSYLYIEHVLPVFFFSTCQFTLHGSIMFTQVSWINYKTHKFKIGR